MWNEWCGFPGKWLEICGTNRSKWSLAVCVGKDVGEQTPGAVRDWSACVLLASLLSFLFSSGKIWKNEYRWRIPRLPLAEEHYYILAFPNSNDPSNLYFSKKPDNSINKDLKSTISCSIKYCPSKLEFRCQRDLQKDRSVMWLDIPRQSAPEVLMSQYFSISESTNFISVVGWCFFPMRVIMHNL